MTPKPAVLAFLIVSIVAFDQLSKRFAFEFFHTVCNEGIAFGLKLGGLGILSAVVIILLAGYFLLGRSTYFNKFGLVLVFAGGVSNLVDRIFRGCVLDFVDLGFWPAFNFADTVICIGVGILIISLIFDKKEK